MLNARGKLLPSVFCLLSSVFCLSFPEAANGATYYVDDANGVDTNPGTEAQPWKTIPYTWSDARGGNIIVEGDTVLFKNGSYGAFSETTNDNGPPSRHVHRTNWITYKAASGHEPHFTSVNTKNYGSSGHHGQSYLQFEGMHVDDGCVSWFADYVVYVDCNITCIPNDIQGYWAPYYDDQACIEFRYGNNWIVQGCDLHGGTRAITTSGSVDEPAEYVTIADNVCHDIAGDGLSIYASHSTITGNYTYNLTNRNSLVQAIGTSSGTWSSGETLVQATTGATGLYVSNTASRVYMWMTSQTLMSGTNQIEGQTSHATITPTDYDGSHVDCLEILSSQYQPSLHDIVIRNNKFTQQIPMPWGYKEGQGLKLDGYYGYQMTNVTIENNLIAVGGNPMLLSTFNDLVLNNNTIFAGGPTGTVRLHTYSGYGGPAVVSQMHNNIFKCDFIADPDVDRVVGSDLGEYSCILSHMSSSSNKPITGPNYPTYWVANGNTGASSNWYSGVMYKSYPVYTRIINHGNNIFASNPATEVRYHGGPLYPLEVNASETVNAGQMSAYFVDPTSLDFQLKAGSPAINFGNATYAPTTDILGNSRVGAPDAGCYEYVASEPNSQSYNLNIITGVNGSVVKSPDKATYNQGETVTLQATPNAGYHFVSWSGDASGTNTSVTITMDSNKSVTANFAINTYTLNVTATNGSVSKTPNKSSYNHGETVTLGATENTGYHFSNWSGDASGTNSTTTIVMSSNKSVTANFSLNTYSMTVTSSNGSVTRTPDKTPYNYGEMVTIQAFSNTGYDFTGWAGDASGSSNPVTLTMDSNKSVTANFVYTLVDKTPPSIAESRCYPLPDAIQVPLNSLLVLHIVDEGKGVDANTVSIEVNNNLVYTGNTADYNSSYGRCRRIGNIADYTYIFQPYQSLDFDQTVTVTVNAADLAGNVMSQRSYSFTTDMRSFSQNKKVGSGSDTLNKAAPATVPDSAGNIWAAWHTGSAGSRDIYVGKLAAGADNFGSSIRLTASTADQCNPAIAIGSDDKLYVAWQDNRIGTWDIYVSTSSDGITWSTERRVTDSNDNQVNPAIAVDNLNRAHIVWQDDRNRNQDIYIAASSNAFLTSTISQITSNIANQIEPAIAVDSSNTVYVVWTDARNSSSDIYGAASNKGPWTNVPIVSNAGNQSSPAIAAGPEGSILHLLWVDDRSGNQDIYYATSNGLPSAPLSGTSIIDDASGANQLAPVIVTSGNSKVFASWQDRRNITDTDLYFAELTSGSRTNIFVGDDGTNADQSEPAMGIGEYGHPYLVWTDGRSANTEIYYAASTFIESVALKAKDVSASLGATVGTDPASISSVDDVSVVVPPGAYLCDVKITISKIKNPQTFATQCLGSYDFGPSGIQFSQPVTVTIPYTFSASGTLASAYWYNSLTGALSQQGITNVENLQISSTLYALRFETTHFTPCYLLGGSTEADDGGSSSGGGGGDGGGGGGGGCSISAGGEGRIVEFLLPYLGLTIVMVILKLRDRRNQKTRSNTESKC